MKFSEKESKKRLFYLLGGIIVLSFFILVILRYVGLVILKTEQTKEIYWFSASASWISAGCDFVMMIAVVITAWYAIQDFWYTAEKDRFDRTVKYVEQLSNKEAMAQWAFFINDDYQKKIRTKYSDPLQFESDKNAKSHEILAVLEGMGLLLYYKKLDIDMLYKFLHVSLQDIYPKLQETTPYTKRSSKEIWEYVDYLYEEFLIHKNK